MEQKIVNLFGEEVVIDDGLTKEVFSKEDILETAFKDFRERGFPYPSLPLFKQKMELNTITNMPQADCIRSNVAYRVADSYHKHRFHSAAFNMRSPVFGFNDDKSLKKVLERQYESTGNFEYGYLGFMSLVNGVQACSNFRPAFARFLYNKWAPKDSVVFDSSTGYGGRLVGFLASHCSAYHGTDPNTLTYQANIKLAEELGKHKNVNLYNSPIEDLDVSHILEACDFSFTSPPYFKKEIYSTEDTQSCNRYPEYQSWIDGFLVPMMTKQFQVLKKGAICIINIEDVKISGKEHELVNPTIEVGKKVGFTHLENDVFPLQARTSVNKEGVKTIEHATETVIVFKKPE